MWSLAHDRLEEVTAESWTVLPTISYLFPDSLSKNTTAKNFAELFVKIALLIIKRHTF